MTDLASASLDKIAPAWVDAQAKIGHATKNAVGQVGQAKISYADLQAHIDAAIPVLHEHDLSFFQQSHDRPGAVVVSTLLMHRSGQWISSGPLPFPGASNSQQTGSALTYARRNCLAMFLGMASEDDDGFSASSAPQQAPSVSQPAAVAERPLSAAERVPLVELALAAGHTHSAATKTVGKLLRSEIPAFRKAMEAKS